MKCNILLVALFCVAVIGATPPLYAESQDSEYKGVSDPFGDPANYEFGEDEKEDKEFFHLGRYLMLGLDTGVGIFTGGLGRNTSPAFYFGLRMVYFFDRSIALEAAVHFADHIQLYPNANPVFEASSVLIPITAGFRYYFDTRNAPKAIAIANPYLAFGGGSYMRQQTVLQGNAIEPSANNTSFGGYGGAGVEFSVYRRHIYLGMDLRYHMIFFIDESDQISQAGDLAGDYMTTVLSLTYSF